MWRQCLVYFILSNSIFAYSDENECYDLHKIEKNSTWINGILYKKNTTEPIDDVNFVNCLCKYRPTCITKCCKISEILKNSICTKNERLLNITPHLNKNFKEENYLFNIKKVEGILLDPELDDSFKFEFISKGSLYLPNFGSDRIIYGKHEYCVDIIKDKRTNFKIRVLLYPEPEFGEIEEKAIEVKRGGMIISMPFLLITFIVYALLPDRNLHMKALMCYVFNLLFAYIFLVTIQLTDQAIENTLCSILGYGCIFFFLSSFFWMNVICVDIFLGFRGFRGVPGVRSSERRRFLLYCLYAWGMSLLIVGITFFLNSVGKNDRWYFPGVSVGQCFIRNGLPQLLYFYGPMGFVIIFNVLLFTLTALKIRQVKKDTSMLKHSESKRHSDDDQQNFYLYMKLLLAMGVNWTMELISWAVGLNNNTVPAYVWYLSDFCNATYGVFIFFIFVFKRNIWKQLKRRYYNFTGRHHLAHSMATTNVTKITSDSMTVSTNDRAL